MKIKCGYFLVVERTTLENLSSTSQCDFQEWGAWVPPFKQEASSTRSPSQAGASGLSCQLALQPPPALKVLPPHWSTRWCLCHPSGTQTGSHLSGWSLQMPRTPCFYWASVHCGRNNNQMSWTGEDSHVAFHPNLIPRSMRAVISLETPVGLSLGS
jgi:hypothetical protein